MDFIVVNLAGADGTAVMSAIDNLSAQNAKGFVICPPDVRLGPAIYARAASADMKVVSVDDQFVTPDGKPMPQVPHLGLSGYKIGQQVGHAIADEMKRRGWKPEEVAACRITDQELPTARERVAGATDVLLAGGFVRANIFDAPQRTTDTRGGRTPPQAPVFARRGDFKKWVIYALNEESVLGGRARERAVPPGTRAGHRRRHQRHGRGLRRTRQARAHRLLRHDRRELRPARPAERRQPGGVDPRRQAAAGLHADHGDAHDPRQLAAGEGPASESDDCRRRRSPPAFLTLSKIEVEFPGVKALRGVDLFVDRGSVYALMGENGAGKSTLLKVLSGVNIPRSGTITIAGRAPTRSGTPPDALAAGIAIIYQELQLIPGLSAAENLMLGQLPRRLGSSS